MTGFDLILAAIIIGSALLALIHGIVKEIIGLVAWILGIGFALLFSGTVGAWFPARLFGSAPHIRYVVAFVLILVAVLIVGGLLSTLLKSGLKAIGLGPVDRILGGLFGVARGIIIAMVVVLVMASTAWAQEPWWRQSVLVPHLIYGSRIVRAALPPDWQAYLDSTLPEPGAPVVTPPPPPAAAPQKA
ncbi:MAG: CvpA family protein [Proteobacteria bacterium]|nr:CvpA family protein [Pseudomonadota bacterium]